jgi:hypothetical protein
VVINRVLWLAADRGAASERQSTRHSGQHPAVGVVGRVVGQRHGLTSLTA